jgi:hypothetical protein
MALSPILNLPVRWQVLGVDVESLAPHQAFSAEAYDVANVNGVLLVENPTEQKVRLVYPFPVEDAHAEVRVLSTGKRVAFKKRDGRAEEMIELLRGLGEIPADQEPVLKELRERVREFMVADIELPAGQQLIRVHARQELRPAKDNPKQFELVFFAPLAGFILAPGGQAQMSVSVAFPPAWAAPGMQIGTPTITPVPGQPAPETQVAGPTPIAERPTYGALWRNDPKVSFPYSYS